MSLALAFWILMLLWLLLHGVMGYRTGNWVDAFGANLVAFILFLLLGWKVFGAPLHG